MASLLSWVGNKVKQDVIKPIQRDVAAPIANVAQRAVNQVNPLDNGRTFKQQTPTNNRSVIGQLTHNGLTNTVGGIAKPLGQFPLDAGTLAYNKVVAPTFKLPQQNIQKNPILGKSARFVGATGTPKQTLASGIQSALTVATPELKGASLLAKTAAGTGLGAAFGGANAYGQGATRNQILKSAAISGALGGILPIAGEGTARLAPVVKDASKAGAQKAVTAAKSVESKTMSTPAIRANLKDQQTLQDYSDYLSGANKPPAPELNQLIANARAVGQKHGVNLTTGTVKDHIDGANSILDTIGKQRTAMSQGGYVKNPLAKSLPDDDMTPLGEAIQAKQAKLTTPTKPVETVSKSPKVVQNRLTKGAKEGRQNLNDEVMAGVQGEHTVRSTQALATRNTDQAAKLSTQDLIDQAKDRTTKPLGTINDEDVAFGNEAIQRAQSEGRTQDAVDIHDAISEHLTKKGQTIQAASLFYKLNPDGMLFKGIRDLKKAGTKITPELQTKLKGLADDIKGKTGQEKQRATAAFHKEVADNIPQSKLNGALSVWKAGLLSGLKTHTGNALSNATFASLKKVSDIPATAVDKGLTAIGKTKLGKKAGLTGERSKSFTTKGYASGVRQGLRSGLDTLRTGVDARDINSSGKYESHGELNFKNPLLHPVGAGTNMVFRAMNAGDQPFYYGGAKNTIADIAKADGINKGLTGTALSEHVKQMLDNPSDEISQKAKLAAQTAVLGQDSKVATALSQFTQKVPAAQVLAPFIKVPTNFLNRTLDYTPVGAVKGAVKAIQSVRAGEGINQRALSEAIGEATTGSALIYLGAQAAAHGLLSGQYPTDPKEQQRWKAQGIQPNAIHVGNKWLSLNYLGQVGLLLNAGHDFHDATQAGDNGTVQAIGSFGKALSGQSFLSGFNGFANAVNDPGRYLNNFINNEAGSVVPSISNDAANLFDNKSRSVSTPLQSIQSRVPGVRNKLQQSQDVYGNPLGQRVGSSIPGRIDQAADPLRPSNDIQTNNPVIQEVARLHNVDPNNKDLQVTPTQVDKSISVEGKNIKLSTTQRAALQKQIGQTVQTQWGQLIQTPEYKSLNDINKAKALSDLRTDATTLATRNYVGQNNLATYKKAAPAAIAELGNGETTVGDYATKAANGGAGVSASTKALYAKPDAEYKADLASYNTKLKDNGFSSPAQQITAQNALNKAKVGSTFDKTTRDLYGLSSDDLYQYASSNPDGNAIVQKVLDYGDALANNGIITKNKFRDKYGAVTLGDTSTSGGSSSKSKGVTAAQVKSIQDIRLKTKAPGFKVGSPKVAKVKTTKPKIPKYSVKTPKVTVKKAVA